MNLKTRTAGQTMVINARRTLGMKTTPQPAATTAAKAEAKAVSCPSSRMRSKGPLQHEGPRNAPKIQEENPLSAQKDTINLPMEMHAVQEEYHVHPDYQCVPIQEVLRLIPEMMMEEEMDLMSQRRTRLFTRMTQYDPLASLTEIQILMVIMIDIHERTRL